MKKFATTALLLTALAVPVALFWLLITRLDFMSLVAAAICVAAGWALNVAWAFAVRTTAPKDPSQDNSISWQLPSGTVGLAHQCWCF